MLSFWRVDALLSKGGLPPKTPDRSATPFSASGAMPALMGVSERLLQPDCCRGERQAERKE